MRLIFAPLIILLGLTARMSANATTWDDIAQLEASKQTRQETVIAQTTESGLYRLSDGRQVDLGDWKVVLFMSASCSHCRTFDPLLKSVAQEIGFSVFPYSLDGKGDAAWPQAIPAPPLVVTEFFVQGLPIATPTLFLVNVNNMKTYPLQQGESGREAFIARLDEVLRFALNVKGAQ